MNITENLLLMIIALIHKQWKFNHGFFLRYGQKTTYLSQKFSHGIGLKPTTIVPVKTINFL